MGQAVAMLGMKSPTGTNVLNPALTVCGIQDVGCLLLKEQRDFGFEPQGLGENLSLSLVREERRRATSSKLECMNRSRVTSISARGLSRLPNAGDEFFNVKHFHFFPDDGAKRKTSTYLNM